MVSTPPPAPRLRCARTLAGHARGVTSVDWSPVAAADAPLLATGSGDATARVWRHDDTCTTLTGHAEGVNAVAFSPDGAALATASDDGTTRLWDVATGRCLRTLAGHSHYVFAVAFSPRAAVVATASFDETVKVWCCRTGACLRTLPAHSDPVTALSFDGAGKRMLTASFDGLARVWCAESGRCLQTLVPPSPSPPPVGGAAFTRNGALVVTSSLDGRVRLWDGDKGTPLKSYRGHAAGAFCSAPAVLSYDGSSAFGGFRRHCVVAGGDDGGVTLWDANTRGIVAAVPGGGAEGHTGPVLGVAVHPTLPMLATAGGPGCARAKVWVDDACGGG